MKQAVCGQHGDAAVFYTAAVLTVSDKGSRGEREDTSGPALQEMLVTEGFQVVAAAVVPDDIERIRERLLEYVDTRAIDLVVTTGWTGVDPRDVTPDATRGILDREVPGMAEAMRAESLKRVPAAMLSRAVVGIRGKTLIVNLPGSPGGATENLAVLLPAIPHAVEKIHGEGGDCAPLR